MSVDEIVRVSGFVTYPFVGMALAPIHVGTGGTRLGRVDNTIVRDPVTRVPKIPGSSFAGVMRAYVAMAKGKYPRCAGLGQSSDGEHCRRPDCPVCTVFGFAKGGEAEGSAKGGDAGGFAGLAGFSDLQVLLFPLASQEGPQWLTCPTTLRQFGIAEEMKWDPWLKHSVARKGGNKSALNFGWLWIPVVEDKDCEAAVKKVAQSLEALKVPTYLTSQLGVVSDKLFTHLVNSNLEVRTSVAIDPKTGAAEEGALFTYEALPQGTVLAGELTCRNPQHFHVDNAEVAAVGSPEAVKAVVSEGCDYLDHLGIGGMGTRGMGRMRVLNRFEKGEES